MSEKPPRSGEYFIGASKKPDGTLDLSKAASWEPSPEVVASQQEYDKKRKEVAAESKALLVGPGTAGRVAETLSSALRKNKTLADKEPEKAPGLEKTISSLESQLNVLVIAKLYFKKENIDPERVTASQMYNKVEEMVNDWENRMVKTPGDISNVEVDPIGGIYQETRYHLDIKIKAARELLQKLLVEMENNPIK